MNENHHQYSECCGVISWTPLLCESHLWPSHLRSLLITMSSSALDEVVNQSCQLPQQKSDAGSLCSICCRTSDWSSTWNLTSDPWEIKRMQHIPFPSCSWNTGWSCSRSYCSVWYTEWWLYTEVKLLCWGWAHYTWHATSNFFIFKHRICEILLIEYMLQFNFYF